MGNQFSDPTTNEAFNDKSVLGKYVVDFYKNNYKFLNSKDANISNFVKKRACCRGAGSSIVPISLPSYDKEKKKIVSTTLDMTIFDKKEMGELQKNCRFGEDDFYNTEKDKKGYVIASKNCDSFYNAYCLKLYKKRFIMVYIFMIL
jgi:hypothetical protein